MELSSKKIEISLDTKKRIDNLTKVNQVRIIDGNYIDFEGTNISCINPAKVFIKARGKELVLLFYGNGNTLYLYDQSNKCTWKKLKELLA